MWRFFRHVVTKGVVSWAATGRVCLLLLVITALLAILVGVSFAFRLIMMAKGI